MPDSFAVAVYVPYPVKGYAVIDPIFVDQLKGVVIGFRKPEFGKGRHDDLVRDAVVVADFEPSVAVFGIPADAIEDVLDRFQSVGSRHVLMKV